MKRILSVTRLEKISSNDATCGDCRYSGSSASCLLFAFHQRTWLKLPSDYKRLPACLAAEEAEKAKKTTLRGETTP